MKTLPLIFLLAVVFSCQSKESLKEYGSLQGNVFWRYNEYVGDRPDAGSSIYLYSLEDSNTYYSTTADLSGNYLFDSIPSGRYLAIVRSQNTKNSSFYAFRSLYYNLHDVSRVFNANMTQGINEANKGKLFALDSLAKRYLLEETGASNALSLYKMYSDSATSEAYRILKSLPDKITQKMGLVGQYPNKIEISNVVITKRQAEKVVTNFGYSEL
jgi:hypothetical protein